MRDRYMSVEHLMCIESRHVRIRYASVGRSRLAVIAPHAGRIEPVTGELAEAIAGGDHRTYRFDGRDRADNARLHITSTRFEESRLDTVLRGAYAIVTIHGCRGLERPVTHIGGRNRSLRARLQASLHEAGFAVEPALPPLAGRHPGNLTNRAEAGGVQLEISRAERNLMRQMHHDGTGQIRPGCDCPFCRYVDAVRIAARNYLSEAEKSQGRR